MKTNPVRAKLKRGEPSLGTWLTLPTPFSARQLAGVGFDWLTVELEHSPTNWESAAQCFLEISAGGVAPLTRLPWNTGENIKRALDLGAWGVIVPMVNSRAEAEAAVEHTRYHPRGNRSVGGQLHAISFGTDPATYYERANDEVLLVVMAEHVKGIENLDAILSVPGIDAVFIGPNDLHKSMGLKPSFESDHPQFVQALEHVRATAKKYGIAPGIHVADAAAALRRQKEGFQFIACASDIGMLLSKGREVAATLGLGKDKPAGAKY
jgi:4-hydroxy-2-oxoheptanedioate aldolase